MLYFHQSQIRPVQNINFRCYHECSMWVNAPFRVEVIDVSPLLGPLPSLPVMSSRRSSWMQQKSEAAAALVLLLGAAASISAASKLEATADAALSVRSGMPLFIFSLPLLSPLFFSPRTVFQFQEIAILLTRDHQLHL